MNWYVYIVTCADETLYTGISTNVYRRVKAHNSTKRGAKYTRSRRPVKISYVSERFKNKSQAMSKEIRIKKLSRKQKILMMKNNPNLILLQVGDLIFLDEGVFGNNDKPAVIIEILKPKGSFSCYKVLDRGIIKKVSENKIISVLPRKDNET